MVPAVLELKDSWTQNLVLVYALTPRTCGKSRRKNVCSLIDQ